MCEKDREEEEEWTETIKTQLHKKSSEDHYTYTNVPWKIYLRKEVSGGRDYTL